MTKATKYSSARACSDGAEPFAPKVRCHRQSTWKFRLERMLYSQRDSKDKNELWSRKKYR
jgi:hypothetical protein